MTILTGNYKIAKSNIDGYYHQFVLYDISMHQPRREKYSFKAHSTLHRIENESDFLTKGFSP